jgi:hypothetical protein
VALCRRTGRVRGFYYDPHSSPFQALELQPVMSRGKQQAHPSTSPALQQQPQQQGQRPERQQQEQPPQQQQQQQQEEEQANQKPPATAGGFVFLSTWRCS